MTILNTDRFGLQLPQPGTDEPIDIGVINDNMVIIDAVMATLTGAETLENKILESPVINNPTGDIVTLTGAETLENKVLNAPTLNSPVFSGPITGNMGLGVTPSAWSVIGPAIEIGTDTALVDQASAGTYLTQNSHYDGAWKAKRTAAAGRITMGPGYFVYSTAPSVSAGSAQSFVDMLYVDNKAVAVAGGSPAYPSTPRYGHLNIGNSYTNIHGDSAVGLHVSYNGYMQSSDNTWRLVDTNAFSGIRLGTNLIDFVTMPSTASNTQVSETTGVRLNPIGGGFYPRTDNALGCGVSGARWISVYAVNGTIQTSSEDVKENIYDLYGEDALAAVRRVRWVSFDYKFRPRMDGESDEEYEAAKAARLPQAGFLAGEVNSDAITRLFSPNGQAAMPNSTASLVGAAVQELADRLDAALARIAELEA